MGQRRSLSIVGLCNRFVLFLLLFNLLFHHLSDLLLGWWLCWLLRGSRLDWWCYRSGFRLRGGSTFFLWRLLFIKHCDGFSLLLFATFCKHRSDSCFGVRRGRRDHSTPIALLAFVWTVRLEAQDFWGYHSRTAPDLVIIFMRGWSMEDPRSSRFI